MCVRGKNLCEDTSPEQKLLVGQDLLQPAGVLQFEGEHGWWGVVGEHFDDAHGERKCHLTCDLHNAPVERGRVNFLHTQGYFLQRTIVALKLV